METLEEIQGVILEQVKQIQQEGTSPEANAHAIALPLVDYFASTQVYFPKNRQTLHKKRDEALRRDHVCGTPVSRLSRKYQLSQTTIYRILNEGE